MQILDFIEINKTGSTPLSCPSFHCSSEHANFSAFTQPYIVPHLHIWLGASDANRCLVTDPAINLLLEDNSLLSQKKSSKKTKIKGM